MCNLYRMTKGRDEVARWFDAEDAATGANFADEVYPGYPGLVVAEGALRQMSWGFPLAMTGARGQPLKPKPVNNARTDKLSSAFWRDSFAQRRCLIPVTAWAEAEGVAGAKTRTWLRRPDAELFAIAGVWRRSTEWGAVYSMVMTDSCGAAAECHTRMPVLLAEGDWARWTQGAPDTALALCKPWEQALVIERTAESWSKPARSEAAQPSLL
jgi:putative SOS response-associated peptidase YedK